jgi:hypothetical protein
MKIGNLVQWFLVNVVRRKPAPVEIRVFPSLLLEGDDASCKDDGDCCSDDYEWDLLVDEVVPAKPPKAPKKTKKAVKPKNKSVKAKKPVGKKAKK